MGRRTHLVPADGRRLAAGRPPGGELVKVIVECGQQLATFGVPALHREADGTFGLVLVRPNG